MTFFITNILLALSLAVDAGVASVAIATKQQKALSRQWVIGIPLVFGALQGLMPLIGWVLSETFYFYIQRYDHWIAFGLLMVVGLNMLRNATRDEDDNPNTSLHVLTIFVLGIATSIDALAVGFTLTTISPEPLMTIIVIFAVTTALCYGGFTLSRGVPGSLANRSELLAGLVLIALACKTLVAHL